MARYFIAIYRPDGFDPKVVEEERMRREIDALNDEMVAAGVRLFVGGLQPVETTASIICGLAGESNFFSGPHTKKTHYLDGFWVLDLSNQDEAIRWGERAALACSATVEVRPFY